MNLSKRTVKELIQFIGAEKLAEEGKKLGSLDAIDFFNSLGYPANYDTFVYLVTEHFGNPNHSRWFQCFYHKMQNQDLFHLQHNLGRKWSVFLDNYLRSLLGTMIKTKVDSRIYDFAVTLKIKRPQIDMRKF